MSTYTLEQVKEHCKPDDVWIIIHNKVYDVTKYLEDHPGGAAVLIEVAGTDATQAFEDIGHSDEARQQLEPYYVGDLPDTEHADTVEVYRPTFEQVAQTAAVNVKKPSAISSTLRAVVKLGLGGAVGAAALSIYRQGWALPHVSSASILSSLGSTNFSSSSHQFWSGVGIASVAQFSLTLSLGIWASTKLDVQQEFTHYKPHRPASGAWLIRLQRNNPATATQIQVLNPRQWRPFTLTSKIEVAPNVYQLTFSLPNATDILNLPTGQHVALRALIDGSQVTRSYTPISNMKDVGHIKLLIKTYPNGAMTQHLAGMKPGETIEMRGPKGAMTYSNKYAKTIGMIAGGTGITPMYQVIRAICEDETDSTRVSLLYANNTQEDILMREELENLAKKFPQKLEVRHVLSRAGDDWKGYRGFVSGEIIGKHIGGPGDTNKVFLCGPPPMINAMKKVLGDMGWAMPGAVTKATDAVFCF
ncbi:hypothetical protein BJY01DRAFT_263567 [Aspergillus pseudoustus]|uniref:Cytochrome B5 n=1 Tax=Aspergillus pseudoustus TaxID=1810923 RepID=A0ABR4K016_9EURO